MRRLTRHLIIATTTVIVATAVAPITSADARYRDWTDYVGVEPVATLSDLEVTRDAISPNGDGTGDSVDMQFVSLVSQHVRVYVVDDDGTTIRTIVDRDAALGALAGTWDGSHDDGTPAIDGVYELVIEAQVGSESMSVSDVVRVDRVAPTVRAAATRVTLAATIAAVRVPLRVSEPAMVDLRMSGTAGRSRISTARQRGVSKVALPATRAAVRRMTRTARGGTARIVATATDPAGNSSTQVFTVTIADPATTTIAPTPIVGSSTITWPVSGPLTSRFGMRWGRMHQGIDIGVPTGRRIGAAAPGRVTYAGWMSGYGNTVIIDHGSIDTLYAHQSKLATRVGAQLGRGDLLGYVGSTGNSTGPHLHFETRVNGAAKNPLTYLS